MLLVNMFPASYGDSFLIQYLEDKKSENILVDCGFADTFNDHIEPALQKLPAGSTLERLIITHLDRDHINGAVPFLEANGSKSVPRLIPIRQIWHNTLRHMQSSKLPVSNNTAVEEVRLDAYIAEHQENDNHVEGIISAKTSSDLGALILRGKYDWNTDFNEQAVTAEMPTSVAISDNLSLILLGPTRARLEDVEYMFKKSLARIGIDLDKRNDIIDDAFEVFVSNKWDEDLQLEGSIGRVSPYSFLTIEDVKDLAKPDLYKPDDAEPNGSSITFILLSEGKRLLFMADSFSEDMEAALDGQDGFFNLIKISHHGAHKNTSPSLLSMIDSERYLISTNGNHPRHLHPDAQTIARIVSRPLRNGMAKRTLYFNFVTPTSKLFCNPALQEYFHYDIKIAGEITL
uniref:MBL fold metallo-hydrolase n=1 Tax=Pedobacter schmidteae TaxID=2201271 RepID=UPI0013CEFF8C|nr:MBL fold metallo-hydrolase [Pedobacter schmidteae]